MQLDDDDEDGGGDNNKCTERIFGLALQKS
jgi:hypothetical protein